MGTLGGVPKIHRPEGMMKKTLLIASAALGCATVLHIKLHPLTPDLGHPPLTLFEGLA